jgi:hypothetical protein
LRPIGRNRGGWRRVQHEVPWNRHTGELSMRRELTSIEARSGVVSGRVITVLLVSFVGACVALALAWYFLLPK